MMPSDLDALVLALWAAAPMYLAARRAHLQPRLSSHAWQELALFLVGAALWLGYRGWPITGLITAIVALLAAASVFVPLTAVRPRLARFLAVLSPATAVVIAALGAALGAAQAGGCHAP